MQVTIGDADARAHAKWHAPMTVTPDSERRSPWHVRPPEPGPDESGSSTPRGRLAGLLLMILSSTATLALFKSAALWLWRLAGW